MQTIINKLASILPTGSGINCDWQFTERKNGDVLAHNSYHCMNEHGFYDGWADFTLIFKKDKPLADFVLQFNGKAAQYKNKRYMLRDYLEEFICYCIHDMQGNSVINKKLSDLVE